MAAGEAWREHAQAHWPETTARVEECYLHQTSTGRRNRYYIDCRLSYAVGVEQMAAHVYSAPAPSREVWQYPPNQIGLLEDWVDRHPPGTEMTVRYDPAKHNEVVLVATDMPRAAGPHREQPEVARFLRGELDSASRAGPRLAHPIRRCSGKREWLTRWKISLATSHSSLITALDAIDAKIACSLQRIASILLATVPSMEQVDMTLYCHHACIDALCPD